MILQTSFRRMTIVSVLIAILSAVVFSDTVAARVDDLSSRQIREAAGSVMQGRGFRGVRRRVLENVPEREVSQGGFLGDMLQSAATAMENFTSWFFRGLFSRPPARKRMQPVSPPPSQAPASSSGSSFDLSMGNVLLYLGLSMLVVVATWIIASLVKKSDPGRRLNRDGLFDDDGGLTNLSTPPGELAASTYESRAIQMAHDGNYRGAVRELLIGGMSWIERAGLIRYRRGLTNRDYVRAVWREAERRDAYQRTAVEFERIYFGRRNASRESFEDCLRLFQGSFREEEKPAHQV